MNWQDKWRAYDRAQIWTSLEHMGIAAGIMLAIGLAGYGAMGWHAFVVGWAAGIAVFAGREHAQIEKRFYSAREWYKALNIALWPLDPILDLALPVAGNTALLLAAQGCTFENHAGGGGHLTVRLGAHARQKQGIGHRAGAKNSERPWPEGVDHERKRICRYSYTGR